MKPSGSATRSTTGTVHGVGVGPGDPKLLTVRAVEILSTVSVVVAPSAGKDETSFALDIVRPYLSPECSVMVPKLPMTDNRATLEDAWENTARIIAEKALSGCDVAFVTLGDSTLYSTWSYVSDALRRMFPEVPVSTVPGVTSASACAAHAGVPLAQGREPLLIWPSPPDASMENWIKAVPNVVFMKAAPHLERIAQLAESSERRAVAVRRTGRATADSTQDLRSWVGQSDYFTTVIVKSGYSGAEVCSGQEGRDK